MAAAAPLQGDDIALHTDPAMRQLLDRLITLSPAQKCTAVVLRRMSRSSAEGEHQGGLVRGTRQQPARISQPCS